MKKWFDKNRLYVIGGIAGAVAGLAYWKFEGCANGNCMITSKPVNSMLYGTALGSLTFGLFQKEKTSVSSKKTNHDI